MGPPNELRLCGGSDESRIICPPPCSGSRASKQDKLHESYRAMYATDWPWSCFLFSSFLTSPDSSGSGLVRDLETLFLFFFSPFLQRGFRKSMLCVMCDALITTRSRDALALSPISFAYPRRNACFHGAQWTEVRNRGRGRKDTYFPFRARVGSGVCLVIHVGD